MLTTDQNPATKALTDLRDNMERHLAEATDPRLKANISRELKVLEYEIARIGARAE